MKKRIVSLLLAVVLVLGLMPTALAANLALSTMFPAELVTAESNSTYKWYCQKKGSNYYAYSGNYYATSTNNYIETMPGSESCLDLEFLKDVTFTAKFTIPTTDGDGVLSLTRKFAGGAKEEKLCEDVESSNWNAVSYTLTEQDFDKGDTLAIRFYRKTSDTSNKTVQCNISSANMTITERTAGGCTITFDANGGTGTMEKQTLADGTGTLTKNAFTKEDCTFRGWATSANGEVVYADEAPITEALTGDVTLYAVWKSNKVTVHFDVGGYKLDTLPDKTKATFADKTVEPTATVTLPEVYPSYYPQTNVNFGGWYVKTDDAENPYGALVSEKRLSGLDVDLSKYDTDSGEITFIVKWKPTTYNVTFNANGGVGTMKDVTGLQAEVPTALPKNQFTKEGYAFVGWKKLKSDYASIAYENGANIQEKISATEDGKTITLYAWWKEVSDATTATVTFDYKDGVTPATTVYVDKGTAIGNKIPEAPAREGYRFNGWALSTNLAKKLTADTVIAENCTYQALWSKYGYKIIFNKNATDATGEMANQWADFDTTITLNKCTFTRKGYDFAGWKLKGDTIADGGTICNNSYYDDWEGETSDYGKEVTLNAIWEKAKSDAQKEAEEKLDAAAALLSKNYSPVFGKDTNLLTMASARLTDDLKGVTVTMKDSVTQKDMFTAATAGVDLDGKLHYKWNSESGGYTSSTILSVNAPFKLTYNGFTKDDVTATVVIGLDEAKALKALKAEAARITLPASISSGSDLPTLPHYLQSASDSSKYNSWAEIKWQSSNAAIKVSNNYDTSGNNWKITVTPAKNDTDVTLTATLTYSGAEKITCSKVFTVKVLGSVKAVNYQELLDTVFGADEALYGPGVGTSAVINKSAVTSDIHYPTTKDMSRVCYSLYGQGFDGKFTPIVITSSNNDVIEAPDTPNSARTMVYRPLPGQQDAAVTVTVKILDRPTGEGTDYANMPVLASKDITLTVKALTQKELDDAAAFMSKVCTEGVYWEGIRKANTSRDSITGDLQWFFEIVPDGDGYKFIRTEEESKWVGVKADSIDGWYDSQKYRAFRSSIPSVIQSENLLIARDPADSTRMVFPEYNTPVKIDSVLTHAVYGKYYEKLKNTADGWKFAKFYKQPVFTVVTVKGTDGVNPNVEQWTLDISVEGAAFDKSFTDLATTYTCDAGSYATMLDALKTTLTKNSYTYGGSDTYMSSVTDADGTTLKGGDDRFGPYSGWMFTVNGSAPMLDSTTYARIDQYVLKKGDKLRFYYVACPTDNGQHTSSAYGVDSKIHVTKEATHEEDGSQWYECAVCGKRVTEVIPATGHTWGDVTYTWNERHTTCTAVRNCKANDGGEDSETANATYAVVTAPTSGTAGLGRWTAVFENEAFEAQTFDVTLPATGGSTGGTAKPSGDAGKPSVRKDSSTAAAKQSVSLRFDDVRSAHWFADAVEYVTENGIMNGTAADTFSPNAPATRAMLVTVLYRLAGSPDADAAHGFADLTRGAWYVDAVAWAAENGIVDGVGASRFAPNVGITREQLALILYRYAQHCGLDVSAAEDLSGYADAQSVSPWAQAAMRWAVSAGLISGRSASALAPQSGATRAEIAQLLMSFAKLLKK